MGELITNKNLQIRKLDLVIARGGSYKLALVTGLVLLKLTTDRHIAFCVLGFKLGFKLCTVYSDRFAG